MSMSYRAEYKLTLEKAEPNCRDIIIRAFLGDGEKNSGSFNGEIQELDTNNYTFDFYDYHYSDRYETREYCQRLARELRYNCFELNGVLWNEGSGGDYRDEVKAKYKDGILDYKYYSGYEAKIVYNRPSFHSEHQFLSPADIRKKEAERIGKMLESVESIDSRKMLYDAFVRASEIDNGKQFYKDFLSESELKNLAKKIEPKSENDPEEIIYHAFKVKADGKTAEQFLSAYLSENDLKKYSQRIEIAYMLIRKNQVAMIAQRTAASSATITKVNKVLKSNANMIVSVLNSLI